MLSIRLRRVGSTKKPFYRVVVADSRSWRNGRFLETLGHYDPRQDLKSAQVDKDRVQRWIDRGARPSETVRSMLKARV
jgi:small subunit ribosomal protein S16